MKKLIACILAVVYLSASSGMVVNVQYCMDKVASVQVNGFGNENICCTDGGKTAGCCSDELKVVKLQESHNAAVASYSMENPAQLLGVPLSFINSSPLVLADEKRVQMADSSPPLASASSIHIRNCVFRI